MELVQSLVKGYEMMSLILAACPLPVQALIQLGFASISIGCLVSVIRYFLE